MSASKIPPYRHIPCASAEFERPGHVASHRPDEESGVNNPGQSAGSDGVDPGSKGGAGAGAGVDCPELS